MDTKPDGTVAPLASDLDDHEIVDRVLAGDVDLFAVLMRRHNRRVFRAVRGILRNDAEAEDVAQDAWIGAYRRLGQFEKRARFTTWLTRIAVRAALSRLRRARPVRSLDELDYADFEVDTPSAEQEVQRAEMARLIERAIDRLPPSYRVVVLLRDVEGMSTAEAAGVLDVAEENLRVRLHRARHSLREHLLDELDVAIEDVFRFDGERCDRMVAGVMAVLHALPGH